MKPVWGENVKAEIVGHVAVVTFDRPPNNHVSVDMMRDLADCLEAVDAGRQARAIVLQAEGKNFCAGVDFSGAVGEDSSSDTANAQSFFICFMVVSRFFLIKHDQVTHGFPRVQTVKAFVDLF